MFAIVDVAGFQEKVAEGDTLRVPTLDTEPGKAVTFSKVLLIAKGDDVKIGSPYVSGAAVEAKVVGHGRDAKIRVFKMKRRKRYRKTQGHRQGYTDIEVTKIKATGGATKAAAAKKEPAKKEESKVVPEKVVTK